MQVPAVLFVVDTRKEIAAVREAQRRVVPVVGVVDTNSDPTGIDYVIPANDDAVGSVTYIVHYIATAYQEGKDILNRRKEEEQVKNEELRVKAEEAKKKQDEDAKKVLSLKEEQKREAEKMAKKAAAAKVEVKKEAAPELAKPGVTKKAGK